MKLYLIRHGQSEANIGHFFGGQTQVNLTEEGRQQAVYAGTLINHIKFDKIYSSDLFRAIDTQRLALPDTECEVLPLIREIDVGKLARHTVDECVKRYGEELNANRRIYNFKPYGGEDFEMLEKRIEKFLDLVSSSDFKRVAAFCHGAFIAATIEHLAGCKVNNALFEAKNCSINVLDYTNGIWKIDLYNYTGPNI